MLGPLAIAVADGLNNRVSLYLAADGALVEHVATSDGGVAIPFDVQEWSGGLLVANYGDHNVLHVTRDGEGAACVVPMCSSGGAGSANLRSPTGVAPLPGSE